MPVITGLLPGAAALHGLVTRRFRYRLRCAFAAQACFLDTSKYSN
jgi:hypothetical protein